MKKTFFQFLEQRVVVKGFCENYCDAITLAYPLDFGIAVKCRLGQKQPDGDAGVGPPCDGDGIQQVLPALEGWSDVGVDQLNGVLG